MKRKVEEMIKKAQDGDKKAFEELYKRTYNRNYYIVYKILNHEQDTLDVLQETYMKIFTGLDKFTYKGPDSFSSWSAKIAVNVAMDFMRKKRPVLFTEMEKSEETGITEAEIEDLSMDYRPEMIYDKKETSDIVEKLLNSLSEEQRVCMILYYLQEMSIREIAQICNCSENTVKSRLYYGRKKIYEQGEEMKKQGILLMEIFPFTWLIYVLKQEADIVRAPVIALKMGRKLAGKVLFCKESANGAKEVHSAIGRGSFMMRMGEGKIAVVAATGALGIGLAVGIWIGKNQESINSYTVTEQVMTDFIEEENLQRSTEKITDVENTEKMKLSERTEKAETEEMVTESTQAVTEALTGYPATENAEEEKTEITEQATESKEKETTTATEIDKVEWDDDYIEWDE